MNREPIKQPMMAPLAAAGGVVAGVSAALVALYGLVDCHVYKKARGECDQIVQVGIPAIVAGFGSLASAWGGLFTFNPALRPRDEKEPRQRDEHGRFV